jgi:hypothetical protein
MQTDDLAKIETWLTATGMEPSRLGALACANNYAVDRIRSGSARIETLHKVLAYIKANPAKGSGK